MDSVCVIIRDLIPDQTAQMNVIEDDQVIEKLFATASDPAFRDSILPRACGAYANGIHPERCQHIGHLMAKLRITIQNQVTVRTRFRKCFPQLLHDPGAGRMLRDIEMEDLEAEVVTGTEECAEAGEEADEKWNHSSDL